ncbi:MAG TPA: metallopeptidase TldD-related protein [Candidatus Didemnitutus sp.]|nr:metallopeptidase TldD-related protein [Candidatus Didemnitutus sp.]
MSARTFSIRSLPRFVVVAVFAITATTSVIAQQQSPVMRAMKAELDRTMSQLKGKTNPPYFLSYSVTEVTSTVITANMGALDIDVTSKNRILDVDLRVGSYQLDNTRSIRGVAFEMGRGTRGVEMPMGDDERALRSVIWSATDKAYRSAAERYGKVLTNLQVKVREEDTSADLSHERAYVSLKTPVPFEYDTAMWRDRVRSLSAMCAGQEHILSGRVSFQTDLLVKYVVNSEGTMIQSSEPIVKMFVIVKAKADDGMSLPMYESYSAYAVDRLPSKKQMEKEVQRLIDIARALRTAPLLETYTGPAILSGRASGVFFHEIFGHRVEGHRQKDVNSSQTFKPFLNKQILPSFINVVFDPTIKSLRGNDIVGAFEYDDDGMPGKRVVAVDSGIFRSFLMSRAPIENFPNSNGHGRRQAGFKTVSRQSNLIVEATTTVPYDTLRTMLRRECSKQNKEFGLLFEDIQGGFTFTGRTVPNAFNVQPLVVYKVFADGRPDELVRGVDLIGTPLTTFNNIVAAADDLGIFNGVCGAESGGVPVSASSPSLLVSTIEVQKKQKSQAKPPLLSDPSLKSKEGRP